MGKGNRKLSCCTTENIGLDLSSCWMDGETGTRHECRRAPIKTVAVIKPIDIEIRNRLGGFFRGYNIISYGFTDASLNIDVVFLLNAVCWHFTEHKKVVAGSEHYNQDPYIDTPPLHLPCHPLLFQICFLLSFSSPPSYH